MAKGISGSGVSGSRRSMFESIIGPEDERTFAEQMRDLGVGVEIIRKEVVKKINKPRGEDMSDSNTNEKLRLEEIKRLIDEKGLKGKLSPKKIIEHPKEQIKGLLDEGLSSAKIGEKLYMGTVTVSSLRKFYDLQRGNKIKQDKQEQQGVDGGQKEKESAAEKEQKQPGANWYQAEPKQNIENVAKDEETVNKNQETVIEKAQSVTETPETVTNPKENTANITNFPFDHLTIISQKTICTNALVAGSEVFGTARMLERLGGKRVMVEITVKEVRERGDD